MGDKDEQPYKQIYIAAALFPAGQQVGCRCEGDESYGGYDALSVKGEAGPDYNHGAYHET